MSEESGPKADSTWRGALWQSLDRILLGGLSFVVATVVARQLGAEATGQLASALALVSIVGALCTLGLDSSLPRVLLAGRFPDGEIVASAIRARRLAGVAAWLLLLPSAWLLFGADHAAIAAALLLAVSWLFPAGEVLELYWVSRGQGRHFLAPKAIAISSAAALRLGASGLLRSVEAVAACTPIASALNETLQRRQFREHNPQLPLLPSKAATRALLERNLPLILASLAIMGYYRLDQLMLYKLVDVGTAGLYAVAIQVYELSLVGVMIFTRAWTRQVTESTLANPDDTAAVGDCLRFMAAVGWSATLLFGFAAGPLIELLYGAEFSTAAEPLRWLGLSTLWVGFGTASSLWLVARGFERLALQRTLIGLGSNAALNLVLIPKHGATGAAIATVLSQLCACWLSDLTDARTRPLFAAKARALLRPSFYPNTGVSR